MTHIFSVFFFFNDTATTEIYTLSLHDALPISAQHLHPLAPSRSGLTVSIGRHGRGSRRHRPGAGYGPLSARDRKSTRLNSSHANISYAVFCLKKKKNINYRH